MMKLAIYTAEEAAEMWCPHVRHAGGGISAFNRGVDEDDALNTAQTADTRWLCHCISKRCMAWRWYETHVKNADGEMERNGETYGYCGLAGKVEG